MLAQGGPASGPPAAFSCWSSRLHHGPEAHLDLARPRTAAELAAAANLLAQGWPTAGSLVALPCWSAALRFRPKGGAAAVSPAALPCWSPRLRLRPEARSSLARPRAAVELAAASSPACTKTYQPWGSPVALSCWSSRLHLSPSAGRAGRWLARSAHGLELKAPPPPRGRYRPRAAPHRRQARRRRLACLHKAD
eukprot:tig00021178_g19214.t1